ncbi:MAG: DegT/DnrJ/EryC1/StrS family aminotransferase [Cyanobacteria bacterium]|nr:DegT/DnrJ/EryC1/StrS family aminotransferase [Cyanobacteriota bacterium]
MIPLIKSTFYNEKDTKKKLVGFIKKANKLSFGRECEKFEKKFAAWQGRKYCIFLNSGSSANLAIIQTLLNLGKIKKGDSIGFSALTWSTNVMPLIQLGLKAIPIDVELNTLNISSQTLSKIYNKIPLKMLFITNLLGFCGDIDQIKKVCTDKKIILIEDNCESLGTVYKGIKLGNFGLASTFSFYVGHHMSTIEGGAVCTDDEQIATMLRIVRAHGWDRNLSLIHQNKLRNKFQVNSTFYSRYTFYDLGFNFRPTEINGFLGNVQLNYLDEIVNQRQKNFLKLSSKLYSNNLNYYRIDYKNIDVISNFAFPLICKSKEIRNKLVKICSKKIEIRPIVGGDITKQPFFAKYMKKFSNLNQKSNSEIIHEQGLYFGNNPELTKKEIYQIIKIFS